MNGAITSLQGERLEVHRPVKVIENVGMIGHISFESLDVQRPLVLRNFRDKYGDCEIRSILPSCVMPCSRRLKD